MGGDGLYTVGDISDMPCSSYDIKSPTFEILVKNSPPEYFPLLGIGFVITLVNIIVTGFAMRTHMRHLKDPFYRLTFRTMMIIVTFCLFALTSFLGMLSLRSSKFLHFIAATFESFCILSFFENMVTHMGVQGYFNETRMMVTVVPPCCCWRCLPPIQNTKASIGRLRKVIVQMIVVQTIVEVTRVINVFECRFDPEALHTRAIDMVVLVSFLFAMWALIVVFRAGAEHLRAFKYPQKFAAFKLMIIVAKFLYSILSFVAQSGYIPSHGVDGVLVMGGKGRISVWSNFITIVFSTLFLIISCKLYKTSDYTPLAEKDGSQQDMELEMNDIES